MSNFKSERSQTIFAGNVSSPWRIAWPYLHEKRTKGADGKALDKPRYEATLLAPKLHADPMQCPNYQALAQIVMEAATKSWQGWPQGGSWPIRDGDEPPKPKTPTVPGQAPPAPADVSWRKGCWWINVGSSLDTGPSVAVLQNGQGMEIPARVMAGRTMYKSGDYVIARINAYTFYNKTFGVNFGIEGVLFIAEGEPIGQGPRSAEAMFGGIVPFGHPNAPGSTVPQPPSYGVAPQAPSYPAPSAPPVAPQPQPMAPSAGYAAPTAAPPWTDQPVSAPQPPMHGAGQPAPVYAPSAAPVHPNAPALPPMAPNAGYPSNGVGGFAPPPPNAAPTPGLPPFPTR